MDNSASLKLLASIQRHHNRKEKSSHLGSNATSLAATRDAFRASCQSSINDPKLPTITDIKIKLIALDKPVEERWIKEAISKLPNGKAAGSDGLPAELFKPISTDLSSTLQIL
ncbi:hypothetical protein HK098_006841, partial [Nowakowskiella sp. JEL0407]